TRHIVGGRFRRCVRSLAIPTSAPSPCDARRCRTTCGGEDPALNQLWDRWDEAAGHPLRVGAHCPPNIQSGLRRRAGGPTVEYIGIDVHKRESQVCILNEGAAVLEERRIRSERSRFAAVLGTRPPARILLEASTESEWVAQCLEELGHEVIVADPNYAAM